MNMSFFPKYFGWFTVQNKCQRVQQRDTDLVDLGNITQASRVIRGSDDARAQCLRNETALLPSDMVERMKTLGRLTNLKIRK